MKKNLLFIICCLLMLFLFLGVSYSANNETIDYKKISNSDNLTIQSNNIVNSPKNSIKINCTTIYSGSTHSELMSEVIEEYPNINYKTYLTTKLPSKLDLKNQDLILLDLYSDKYTNELKDSVDEAKKNNAVIIVLSPETGTANRLNTVNLTKHPYINEYFKNGGYENEKRLMQYILINFFGLNEKVNEPVNYPHVGIYHPKSDKPFNNVEEYLKWYKSKKGYIYNENNPTVSILFHKDTYIKEPNPWIDDVINELESRNINAIAEFGSLGDSFSVLMNTTSLKPYLPIDLIISTKSYRLRSYSDEPIENGIKYLEALNVPIIRAVANGMYQITPEEWFNSSDGIPSNLIGTRIELPEMDGIFETMVVGAQIKKSSNIWKTVSIKDQLNWMIDRVESWINLQRKDNYNKKIALIYYHHVPGKGDVGVMDEGGLDTHISIINFLNALKSEGYNVGKIPTVKELIKQLKLSGKNVGVWAPGEIELMVKNGNITLIPLEQYLGWFHKLPKKNQDAVNSIWGEAPGNVMVYKNQSGKYIIIPKLQFGNILLAPQPMRSKDQNINAMFTANNLPPTHQYIAFYMYMNKIYEADALIHFGTYGSFEYLPGKQTGLSITTDWSAILIQDMPHIYLYTIDGLAGATQAKRRANAVLIGYSTPPIIASGLYGDLATLENDIKIYNQIVDPIVKENQRKHIISLCKNLSLEKDLGINLDSINESSFESFKMNLSSYLNRLKSEYMPYGLHVLGESISSKYLTSMVKSMLGIDFNEFIKSKSISDRKALELLKQVLIENQTIDKAQLNILGKIDSNLTEFLKIAKLYSTNLNSCKKEITSVLNILKGGYVIPGPGGDPIRKPNSLPSGRILYGFDSREVPIKASRDLGVKMAQELINNYLKENGKYPTQVSVFLWATESMKHLGVMESEILSLLGVKVDYDKYNRPTKLSLIPIEELGRPRIDVLVVASGIYRDTFPLQMKLLDSAIRLAAEAYDGNNSKYKNHVKENSENLYKWLINEGHNKTVAKELSMSRIFSADLGGYGPSLSVPISHTDKWNDEKDIADLFTRGWGYSYGGSSYGVPFEKLFFQNLKNTDVVTHSISSNNYGLLYGDGYFSDLGGLVLASKVASGKVPSVYINNLRNINSASVESVDKFLSMELRSRNLNPNWIKGMMGHGYYGASTLSSGVENLFGWSVTYNNAVTQSMWDDVIDTYVYDKQNIGVNKWLSSKENAHSMVNIYGTILMATQKGYVNLDQKTLTDIANKWADLVTNYGASCCHCTCSNLAMVKWASDYINVDLLKQFNEQMYNSTSNSMFIPDSTDNPITPNDKPYSKDTVSDTSNTPLNEPNPSQLSSSEEESRETLKNKEDQSTAGEGESKSTEKAYEVSKNYMSSSKVDNAMPIIVIIAIFGILALFGYGFNKKKE